MYTHKYSYLCLKKFLQFQLYVSVLNGVRIWSSYVICCCSFTSQWVYWLMWWYPTVWVLGTYLYSNQHIPPLTRGRGLMIVWTAVMVMEPPPLLYQLILMVNKGVLWSFDPSNYRIIWLASRGFYRLKFLPEFSNRPLRIIFDLITSVCSFYKLRSDSFWQGLLTSRF